MPIPTFPEPSPSPTPIPTILDLQNKLRTFSQSIKSENTGHLTNNVTYQDVVDLVANLAVLFTCVEE